MGRKLGLDTAAGSHIDNEQGEGALSPFETAQFADHERRYGVHLDWRVRAEPTPRYNCHGLVFASRRTVVSESDAVELLLTEDGYQEVEPASVLPGDVLIYFEDGEPIHSAIVAQMPHAPGILPIPLVISKWGRYRELVHRANNCPYSFGDARYFRMVP